MAPSLPPVAHHLPSVLKATALMAPRCVPFSVSGSFSSPAGSLSRGSRFHNRPTPSDVPVRQRLWAAPGGLQATLFTGAECSSLHTSSPVQAGLPVLGFLVILIAQTRTVPSSLAETTWGFVPRVTATPVIGSRWPGKI